jgi:hypothetical protein
MSQLEILRSAATNKLIELKNFIEEVDSRLNKEDHFYLSKIVEELKYHGIGDEGIELFQAMCSTAYQMNGIGERWQAILLVLFAAEYADNSDQNDSDFETGHWGY